MKKTSLLAAMALLMVSLWGSAALPGRAAGSTAFIRVIHASPDAGKVDVLVDGTPVLQSIAYQSVSYYLTVPAGKHDVALAPAGRGANFALVTKTALDLGGGTGYFTLVLMDKLPSNQAQYDLIVTNDDLRAMPAGKTRLRFINASPGLDNANITMDDKYLVDAGLAPTRAAGYFRFDAGQHSVRVTHLGILHVTDNASLQLDAGKVYDIILAGVSGVTLGQDGTVDLITATWQQQSGLGQAGDEPTPPTIPGSGGGGLPPLPPQWYQTEYDPHFNPESGIPVGAIALDQAGDGWMARGETLWALQSGKLTASNFSFANMAIQSIALSSDGTEGWALGFNNAATGTPPAMLLHYQNRAWSSVSVGNSIAGVNGRLALDAIATNGWAVVVNPRRTSSTLLRLSSGEWSDASSMIPDGAVLTNIATDLSNQHTWAAGFISATTHPALYYLKDGKFGGGEVSSDIYTIRALTLDGSGNGWAVSARPQQGGTIAPLLRLHADGTTQVVSNPAVDDAKVTMSQIAVDQNGNGWAFGSEMLFSNQPPVAVIEKVSGDGLVDWQYQGPKAMQGPQEQLIYNGMQYLAVSSSGGAWASSPDGTLLRFGNLPFSLPALNPAFSFAATGTPQCFANQHCLSGLFLIYWQQHGGLTQFGLPVTEPLLERLDDGKIYTVQYTERARMEYHPENQPPYTVLLGLLGDKLAKGRENETPFQPAKQIVDFYFPQTSHNLEGVIASYWMQNGALPVFGLPISEAFEEKSPTDGKTYLVQYFERNRLEYHPENSDPQYKVLLGLLGVQQFQANYGMLPLDWRALDDSPSTT